MGATPGDSIEVLYTTGVKHNVMKVQPKVQHFISAGFGGQVNPEELSKKFLEIAK
jgi:hypothetical protein